MRLTAASILEGKTSKSQHEAAAPDALQHLTSCKRSVAASCKYQGCTQGRRDACKLNLT